jgi:photosystem II stability/assembly factor-like uncharacterized protein
MSNVRVLVGTRKGAFILTSDGKRDNWQVSGPHFAGWEIYHMKGSPVDPDRIYASQSSGWFGQILQASNDGGKTWFQPGVKPEDAAPQWPPVKSNRFATDGGVSWHELPGLRGHGTGPDWQPGAGGMCLHTIILDPTNPDRIYIAISAAGAFRTDDAGKSWKPINKGLVSNTSPNPTAEVGHCVHHIAMHPSRPGVLFMQKHWDVMRSDNAGDNWHEISGNLPTDFGFVIDVHSHEPETLYVVPIKSDSLHFPIDGKLQVYRSRTGGNEWEPLTKGLPQENCYVNVLRDAMSVDTLDDCGIYFGTTGGQVYASTNGGDSWSTIVHDLPAVLSVEVQTLV